MVEGDLQAVRCFRRNAGFPLDRIPVIASVMKGLKRTVLETEELNRIGFEPEMIQILLGLALLDKEDTNTFVNQRQAALYIIMYWCTARFEEANALTVGQVVKKGLSFLVNIKKGKSNQEKKLYQCFIHPNSSGSFGNFDPVLIFAEYLKLRKSFVNTNANDHLFPNLTANWCGISKQTVIMLKVPDEAMRYDNYRKRLKAHLEHQDMTSLGVTAGDFGTHSFRIGGLSVLGNDGQVQPAFVQKSARHKHLNSTMRYIRPSLKSSLQMSDVLCGNDPDKGWTEKFTGRRHTQIPFLNHTQVRSSTNSAGQTEFFTAAQSQEEGFVRKSPPGPPKNPQPPKRKASGVQWSFSAKRRTTPVPQTPPIREEEVEAPPVVTPSRSEPQTGGRGLLLNLESSNSPLVLVLCEAN